MNDSASYWRPAALLASVLISALLFGSYFYQYTRRLFWHAIDRPVAYALNSLIEHSHAQQILWAAGNLRAFDYVIAVAMLAILVVYTLRGNQLTRSIRCAQCVIIGILLLALVSLTRHVIFGRFDNDSPSMVLEPFTLLSEEVTDWPWKIKDHSGTSYPGDHATVVATFTFLLWVIAGWRYGLAAAVVSVIAVLPRMVAGAHWFSDIVAGGVATAFLVAPWVVFTPIAWWLALGLSRPLRFMDGHTAAPVSDAK